MKFPKAPVLRRTWRQVPLRVVVYTRNPKLDGAMMVSTGMGSGMVGSIAGVMVGDGRGSGWEGQETVFSQDIPVSSCERRSQGY